MRNTFLAAGVLTLAMWCGVSLIGAPGDNAARLRATVAGATLSDGRVQSVVVDGDTTGVDAATVVVDIDRARPPAVGDPLSVDVVVGADRGSTIFKGEVVGIEPVFDTPGGSKVTIRAFNRLHRLTRGTKTRTFEKMSDADIARTIAKEAGLAFGSSGPEAAEIQDQVYQEDQTDLAFLGLLAARIGYEVRVDDTTLFFERSHDHASVELGCGQTLLGLRVFHPHLASAKQVTHVVVRGYDPKHQREIVGVAHPAAPIRLSVAAITAPAPGRTVDLGFVQALEGEAASYGAALGTLTALTAEDLAAEVDADGSAALRVGAQVEIAHPDARFDGKYSVIGVSHRYLTRDGEFHTLLRTVRADRAFFVLPELGDEVLVAFENGDIARPYVVGSLWNGKDKPQQEAPVCDSWRPHPHP